VSSKDNPVKNPQNCPGLRDFLRPSVAYVKCHVCGGNVEIWSDENVGICNDCGAEWKRPDKTNSCLDYCEYAEKCKGLIESRKT
jgi:hypothetical protein